jgi:hypothetical protein
MIKLIRFLIGFMVGIFILNHWVFSLFLQFIKNENAVAIICSIITMIYIIVLGCLISEK